MYQLIKPLLFSLSPESAHRLTLGGLDLCHSLRLTSLLPARVDDPVEVMGLKFPNRVGLAAGLDKDAGHIDSLGSLGFGFIEVGTVTPRPQPGNPRPRLFRLRKSEALINRMGFNNSGVEEMVQHLARRRYPGVLGVNIGKNFDTPLESAAEDYCYCLESVYALADYITVNISSPNTPGLRSLQNRSELLALLERVVTARDQQSQRHQRQVPLVVKIAPDLSEEALRELADCLVQSGVDGVIATNTTLSREGLQPDAQNDEAGGLSGAPLAGHATHVVAVLADELAGRMPIIAAGGIMSAEDASAKMDAGASLVQLYTGLIYRGPGLVRQVAAALARQN